jgi:flagellar biosynthesis protein FlhF
MKIKSYFSRSVEDAMAAARQELGPEAMLVRSRRATAEARHLGEYEVVFAVDVPQTGELSEVSSASAPVPAAAAMPPVSERISVEFADLKRELESMRRALARTAYVPPAWPGAAPSTSDSYAMLVANEVSPEIARDMVQTAESKVVAKIGRVVRGGRQATAEAMQRALVEEIESRFTVEPALGASGASPRVAALIGPPAAGKTTTLVKLAVNYGLAARKPVLLLSMDNYRVAAAEQLRSYAAILGVGFQLLETVPALAQAIEENRGKELILIDTPGLGPADLDNYSGLAQFFASRPDIDVHLVLPASMKATDLARVADGFGSFQPRHLLFTKLDETSSYGAIFNEAVRTSRPLSFFSSGQRIPEDLEEAARVRVVELILCGSGRARSVA